MKTKEIQNNKKDKTNKDKKIVAVKVKVQNSKKHIKSDMFIQEDSVVLSNHIYNTLSQSQKMEYDSIFAEYNMDLFYDTLAEITGNKLSSEERGAALRDFNKIKTILILLHKSQHLAAEIDPLLASIILNVKLAILMGEDKVRDLGNMCALFAINQAEEITGLLDDKDADSLLSDEEKKSIEQVRADLDYLVNNKEVYLETVSEYVEQSSGKNSDGDSDNLFFDVNNGKIEQDKSRIN